MTFWKTRNLLANNGSLNVQCHQYNIFPLLLMKRGKIYFVTMTSDIPLFVPSRHVLSSDHGQWKICQPCRVLWSLVVCDLTQSRFQISQHQHCKPGQYIYNNHVVMEKMVLVQKCFLESPWPYYCKTINHYFQTLVLMSLKI